MDANSGEFHKEAEEKKIFKVGNFASTTPNELLKLAHLRNMKSENGESLTSSGRKVVQ